MTRLRRGLAAAVVVLVVGACGQKGETPSAPGESAAPVESTTSTTATLATGEGPSADVGGNSSTTAPKQSARGQTPSNPSATTVTAAPKEIEGVRLTVPRCAVIGRKLHVVVDGPPRALVAMMLAYADGQSRDATATGEADQNGHLEADLPISLTAPSGAASLFVAVNAESGGGDVQREVEIVKSEASCR